MNELVFNLISTVVVSIFGTILFYVRKVFLSSKNQEELNTISRIVKICVVAGEQIYKELKGEDKYNQVVLNIEQLLTQRGIQSNPIEIKQFVEKTVLEMNKQTIELFK